MIELQNVSLKFEAQSILESVNLTIQEKAAVAILGPSGAGKSSLLKLIAGILLPTSGTIQVAKQAPHQWLRQPSKIPLSMLFQKNALFDSMTVFENVAFPLYEKQIYGPSEIHNMAEEALEQVGLLASKDAYPDEISGGMQKRLGIARSLALRPSCILYDDPTAGLDPITSRGIATLIRDMQTKHEMTIVSVTNDMDRAKQLAENFLFVHNRQLTSFSSLADLEGCKDPAVFQFIRGLEEGPLREQE